MTDLLAGPPARIAPLVQLFLARNLRSGPSPFEVATDEALDHARALGPALAAEAIAWVLDGFQPGGDHRQAERAADVVARLRLEPAAPALVRCLERLSEYDPVAHAAVRALEALGAAAAEPLLAAFARCEGLEDRVRLGDPLSRLPVGDGRVCTALERLLPDAPEQAAGLLASHGDRRALPALAAAFDRLELPPAGPGELARLEALVAVGQAILALDGELTAARQERFDRAYERSDELLADGQLE